MTFSICVREPYRTDADERAYRFGVAVTTRLPGVGALCPFVGESGALAIQSHVDPDLGERALDYLDDGLAIDDVVAALLNADAPEQRRNRQIHGVDREDSVVVTGDSCVGAIGEYDGDHYTVAGNLLTDEAVVRETADAYEASAFGDRPLAERLIDALEAGHAAGGDKREALSVQSAAVTVVTTESTPYRRFYNDLRVDASETPIADLKRTYEGAMLGYEQMLSEYASAEDIEANRPE
ncbi:DUF1028 domain-containing protein [Halonotius terrestris]|uniref:DUF1028 domain-containing protein n=1 Tax=Halonotius terrestris TaxID=2487750 RepID=A0A8J8TBP9_9EURY|nr:DUF1028 domain-containing protein [Halonotius terrestris]TQQ82590.1 DUF1028 domain-containing protein [Halonotius terrestris]